MEAITTEEKEKIQNNNYTFEDDKNQNSSTAQEFAEIGLFGNRTNINNEIQTIKATSMMEQVVKRLHLDMQMDVPQRLRTRPLYNDAPVVFTLGNEINDKISSFWSKRRIGYTVENRFKSNK